MSTVYFLEGIIVGIIIGMFAISLLAIYVGGRK